MQYKLRRHQYSALAWLCLPGRDRCVGETEIWECCDSQSVQRERGVAARDPGATWGWLAHRLSGSWCISTARMGAESNRGIPVSSGRFKTTHWSVVLNLGQGDPAAFAAAFEKLSRAYWYPLYAHIRHHGYSPEDAEDLTQGFFLHLIERRPFAGLDPSKGHFRSFLLGALKLFLADQRDRGAALKRGGGRPCLSLDAGEAEARYAREPVDNESPDRLFERRWAVALLDQVMARLAADYTETDRAELFRHLKPFLVEGARTKPYAVVADELHLSEAAVNKAVQRLRQRYGRLFREEIAQTLADPAEVEDELRYLREVIST